MVANEQALRDSTKMWELVGSALCQGDMDSDVYEFMADWRSRKDASSWGLYALACSLWDQKKEHEADKVSVHAIKNCEPDVGTGPHMVMAASYQVIYGSPELAFEFIRDVDPMGLNGYFQYYYEQVVCVLQNLGSQGSYGELRDQLKALHENQDPERQQEAEMQRIYKLVQHGAARLHGKKIRAMKWKLQAK